jgi:hypothetical protein
MKLACSISLRVKKLKGGKLRKKEEELDEGAE